MDMTRYMKKMCGDFESKYVLNDKSLSLAANDLFANDKSSPKLDDEMQEDFHTYTARGLFACKCARPDTATSISVQTTRVQSPLTDDWQKLVCYMPVSYTHLTLTTILLV